MCNCKLFVPFIQLFSSSFFSTSSSSSLYRISFLLLNCVDTFLCAHILLRSRRSLISFYRYIGLGSCLPYVLSQINNIITLRSSLHGKIWIELNEWPAVSTELHTLAQHLFLFPCIYSLCSVFRLQKLIRLVCIGFEIMAFGFYFLTENSDQCWAPQHLSFIKSAKKIQLFRPQIFLTPLWFIKVNFVSTKIDFFLPKKHKTRYFRMN